MKITYQEESISVFFEHASNLIQKHWEEAEFDKDKLPLDLDYHRYQTAYNAGMLKIFTARWNTILVGYCAVWLTRNIQHKFALISVGEALYVLPEFRKGGTGLNLLIYTEQKLKEYGVLMHIMHCKSGSKLKDVLERMKYKPDELTYRKFLKED